MSVRFENNTATGSDNATEEFVKGILWNLDFMFDSRAESMRKMVEETTTELSETMSASDLASRLQYKLEWKVEGLLNDAARVDVMAGRYGTTARRIKWHLLAGFNKMHGYGGTSSSDGYFIAYPNSGVEAKRGYKWFKRIDNAFSNYVQNNIGCKIDEHADAESHERAIRIVGAHLVTAAKDMYNDAVEDVSRIAHDICSSSTSTVSNMSSRCKASAKVEWMNDCKSLVRTIDSKIERALNNNS